MSEISEEYKEGALVFVDKKIEVIRCVCYMTLNKSLESVMHNFMKQRDILREEKCYRSRQLIIKKKIVIKKEKRKNLKWGDS